MMKKRKKGKKTEGPPGPLISMLFRRRAVARRNESSSHLQLSPIFTAKKNPKQAFAKSKAITKTANAPPSHDYGSEHKPPRAHRKPLLSMLDQLVNFWYRSHTYVTGLEKEYLDYELLPGESLEDVIKLHFQTRYYEMTARSLISLSEFKWKAEQYRGYESPPEKEFFEFKTQLKNDDQDNSASTSVATNTVLWTGDLERRNLRVLDSLISTSTNFLHEEVLQFILNCSIDYDIVIKTEGGISGHIVGSTSYNSKRSINTSADNNPPDRSNGNVDTVTIKLNCTRLITFDVPLFLIGEWIRDTAPVQGDENDSGSITVEYEIESYNPCTESSSLGGEKKNTRSIDIPSKLPGFFRRDGLRLFLLAKECGRITLEDYNRIMSRLQSDSKEQRMSNIVYDKAGTMISLPPSPYLQRHDERSHNNRGVPADSTASDVRPLSAGSWDDIYLEAARLSGPDIKKLKLLWPLKGQRRLSYSQLAILLGYRAGKNSRGSAHGWLKNMEKKRYITMRLHSSGRGITVSFTEKGGRIISAIRRLYPS
jgi:hypothetical protein